MGKPLRRGESQKPYVEQRKPAPLKALTGLRCFAAVNIVLFHFSNPDWFGFMAPVVNSGFISVSYFILLSGFVLGYNYNERACNGELDRGRFWKARFTRIYPIYLLSIVLALPNLPREWGSHTHAMYWTGLVLTPLLLQGWIPAVATFLNTPAWTMSAEAFYYFIFPWLAKMKKPTRVGPYLWKMAGVWALGVLPGALYMVFNPDGIAHPDRYSYGIWLWALKYTPYAHVASFLFGVMLANVNILFPRESRLRLWMAIAGFGGIYVLLSMGARIPYALIHDGLLMPLFGFIVLGLAGENAVSHVLGARPLVFIGESSYCLYLLHFNMWQALHDTHLLEVLGLKRFDPWLSYVLLICMALLALHYIEKPAQKKLRQWMGAGK